MSANNQTLIVKQDSKFYVYENIMAESWEEVNELKPSKFVYDTQAEAYEKAQELDVEYNTEYGIWFDELAKDGAKVIIKD